MRAAFAEAAEPAVESEQPRIERFDGQASSATEVVAVALQGQMGSICRPARQPGRGMRVVISPPVGREFMWTYRSAFLWAENLASYGFQLLRYDHRGEGDSLDLDPSADRWAHWSGGLKQAASFARACRALARAGVAALRFEFRGVGECAEAAEGRTAAGSPAQPGLSIALLPELDHGLRSRHSQDLAIWELFEFVGTRGENHSAFAAVGTAIAAAGAAVGGRTSFLSKSRHVSRHYLNLGRIPPARA